jgi:hypothetical protein
MQAGLNLRPHMSRAEATAGDYRGVDAPRAARRMLPGEPNWSELIRMVEPPLLRSPHIQPYSAIGAKN